MTENYKRWLLLASALLLTFTAFGVAALMATGQAEPLGAALLFDGLALVGFGADRLGEKLWPESDRPNG